jgi:uncharacterized protein YyaL (SSP411 family)/DsbC/DsbD-like thiol-disulfide interchange protein
MDAHMSKLPVSSVQCPVPVASRLDTGHWTLETLLFRSRLLLGICASACLLLTLAVLGCNSRTGAEEPDAAKAETKSAAAPDAKKSGGNRLAKETSPYLLMHARNPVDWYPWGPEALEKARAEGKMIFLSVGYSSCHWCHVMEHLVFSNPEIAQYMNQHFVNVKVDREERPDIDDVYMTALTIYYQQLKLPQSGGWPLSMFLTPDAKPLGGGTYFPPFDEEGRKGFLTLMKKVVAKWKADRTQLEANAEFLAKGVQSATRLKKPLRPLPLTEELATPVTERLAAGFDPQFGGFGYDVDDPERPKFPVPVKLAFLQYEASKHDDKTAGQMLALTLDRMADGGIYDHIGGGFHRYSTDRKWQVPHFEKMLYDNAQLAEVYAEAFQQTGDVKYRDVAEGIITFVLRDLTDVDGAFYSALDADTDGVEGKHYLWTRRDLAAALSPEEAQLVETVYGLQGEAPFEQGYVLAVARPMDDVAREWRLTDAQLQGHLQRIRGKLLAVRQKRPSPLRDDKILTCWNGLMIRALARTGAILKRRDYVQSAERAATFVLKNLRDEHGRLLRTYCQHRAHVPAYLDDYAFLVEGLLALHEATADDKWKNAAVRLTDQQLSLFWDEQGTACYFTAEDHEALLARVKSAYDSVLPSGNSVTVRNLVRLAAIGARDDSRDAARETLELFAPMIDSNPAGLTNMVLALREYLDAPGASSPKPGLPKKRVKPIPDESQSEGIDVVDGEKPVTAKTPEIVTADVYFSTDKLPAGGQGKVLVLLKIEKDWHIQANPTKSEDEEPTVVKLNSRTGVKAGKIKYPTGKPFKVDDEIEHLVYEGQVGVLIPLEIPVAAGGKAEELIIEVEYQPCLKVIKCLPPATLTLKVPVNVARKGDPVKPINSRLFAPAAAERK